MTRVAKNKSHNNNVERLVERLSKKALSLTEKRLITLLGKAIDLLSKELYLDKIDIVLLDQKIRLIMAYVFQRRGKRVYCNRCGSLVIKSDIGNDENGYKYQCLNCDEDLFESETYKK